MTFMQRLLGARKKRTDTVDDSWWHWDGKAWQPPRTWVFDGERWGPPVASFSAGADARVLDLTTARATPDDDPRRVVRDLIRARS